LTSYLYVKYNNGSGIFSSGTSILTAGHPISMTASDFNGDGKTDVAVCHRDVSNIYIIKHQNGVMNLSGGGYASYQSIQYYPTSFCAADFDNDGDIDLGAATSQGKFLILSNTPSGFLGIGMFTPSGFGTSPSYQIISSADFDNDGNMDLVASSYSDMYILKNNGAGSLTQVASFNLGTGFPEKGVTTADAEGDGDIDVIVANGQSVFVIKNNGSNNFSLTTVCTCRYGYSYSKFL
jgi:hypothetical protein